MKIISIDPGDLKSAAVLIDAYNGIPIANYHASNSLTKGWLHSCHESVGQEECQLVIEYTPPYTMSVGNGRSFVPRQVVDTAIEIGRFMEFWSGYGRGEATLLSRIEVKKHLLGKTTGTDAMVRAALMDRFGGERKAVGAKKCDACKGRGTSGTILETCPECGGSCHVDGKRAGSRKLCPKCKATGVVKGDKATCDACRGSKWSFPPGPMHGITADLYAALAVGLMYCDQKKLIRV